MVNTFVTSRNFKISANNLDLQRLRKQCVESTQILGILNDLEIIAEHFSLPKCPSVDDTSISTCISTAHSRNDWVKMVRSWYLNQAIRIAIVNDIVVEYGNESLPFILMKSDRYHVNPDSTVTVWIPTKQGELNLTAHNRNILQDIDMVSPDPDVYDLTIGKRLYTRVALVIPKSRIIFPDSHFISLGFSSHPIVKMWCGYTDSLKSYINAHIELYTSKKKQDGSMCTMNLPRFRNLPKAIQQPWWLRFTGVVINSHKASLNRKLPSFYSFKIPKVYSDNGYIWACNLSSDEMELVLKHGNDPEILGYINRISAKIMK